MSNQSRMYVTVFDFDEMLCVGKVYNHKPMLPTRF